MQFDNGLPIYLQIVKEMTLRALSGAIEPGGKIPPVRELAAEFGVNPNTMQRAMAEMEREGLVYTEEGVLVEKRKSFAKEETEKYLAYMKKIGFTTEEVASYVKAVGEKGEEQA